ncbi:hypothetical protein CFBP6626_22040 [Agrobacterium tumefaciens]|nr:hypothetical protein CFBP6626_22040 [Agrobacterium tumefaciens]
MFLCGNRGTDLLRPSFLCLSQESSRRASARRKDSSQPKDLGWLDPCDKHRDEEGAVDAGMPHGLSRLKIQS